jgi:hypothetical protein
MKSVALVTALVLSTAAMQHAGGRNIEVPTSDELFEKSDFIVIAQPATNTRDTSEHALLTQNISPGVSAVGVVTEFECLQVIKGAKRQRFTLHHYRYGPSDERIILNGPTFMTFAPEPGTQPFLMFLVRERDGRFAPVAGQVDPVLSVQQIKYM